jgi:voltage-gated potassium channel
VPGPATYREAGNKFGKHDTTDGGVGEFQKRVSVDESQHRHNPAIGNHLDALYFTVATLTTTGFGDITLTGTSGRLLAIVMMIVGVSLFVRMVQVLFRPRRLHVRCSSCGLSEHDSDAIYCKRCRALLTLEAAEEASKPISEAD